MELKISVKLVFLLIIIYYIFQMTGCIIFLSDVLTGKNFFLIKWKKQNRIIQNSKITHFCTSVARFLSKINEVIISVNPDGSTRWRTAHNHRPLQFICQKCQIGCQISAFGKCVKAGYPLKMISQWRVVENEGPKSPFWVCFDVDVTESGEKWVWVVYFIVIWVKD